MAAPPHDPAIVGRTITRAADFAAHVPGMPEPLDGEGWRRSIAMFFGGFPDMRLVVEDIVANGDRDPVPCTFHGTHQ